MGLEPLIGQQARETVWFITSCHKFPTGQDKARARKTLWSFSVFIPQPICPGPFPSSLGVPMTPLAWKGRGATSEKPNTWTPDHPFMFGGKVFKAGIPCNGYESHGYCWCSQVQDG